MSSFDELGIKSQPGKIRYSALCPQCSHLRQKHKNVPCLTVNDEPGNQWYKCHNCNWSGNLGNMEKFKQVQEHSRMPKQMAETYSKEVREYWDKRGIDMRIPLRHKIYEYSIAGKPILGFPTYMSQTLVDVKYLNIKWNPEMTSPKWWNMPKKHGSKTLPWGIDQINFVEGERKIVVITEGHVDAMTWEQCGYKNILSVPSGAPSIKAENFEHEFDYLTDKYTQSVLAGVELYILATDNDAPGIKLRSHLALILGREKCKYVNYPIGYKDSNEVYKGVNKEDRKLSALGKTGIDDLYQSLSSFPIAGIIRPSDCRNELEIYAKTGFIKGLGMGMPEIDKLYTLKPKRLQVVTGLPGSGKSTFVRWHITELISHNDKENLKFGLFTPENRPVSREYVKIAEVITGQSFKEGWNNSMSNELRQKTMRFIEKHFFVISPDRRNFDPFNGKIKPDKVNTMASLCEYLVYLKKTENIFGYVIDAWNKIEHEQPKNITETSYISSQLDHLIDFNDYYDLHGIIIAHPTKVEKVGINYRMPCLYDIKGSSAWKEKADIGIIVHRNMNRKKKAEDIPQDADEDDKYYVDPNTPTIVRTEKIRFEEEGVCDRVKLVMDFKRGGKFALCKEEKPPVPEIPGKLNPKNKEEDNVFGDKGENDDNLPF